jgi:hypothetical protein
MHIVTTRPVDVNLPMFFNVDTSVGKDGRNSSPEDILLVQFLLQATAGAATARNAIGEARRQRVLKVPVTGVADAATMDGIQAWQEGRKQDLSDTIIDGRIDSARGVFYARSGEWTIVDLNGVFRGFFPKLWPRLQDHPKCPAALKTRVAQVL